MWATVPHVSSASRSLGAHDPGAAHQWLPNSGEKGEAGLWGPAPSSIWEWGASTHSYLQTQCQGGCSG